MIENTDSETITVQMIFRKPRYPVMIVSGDRLRAAKSFKGLAQACVVSTIPEGGHHVTIIDITGDEFWYLPDTYLVSPGFLHKRWTKKRMIDLYNQSTNAAETGKLYSDRSLGNKSLERVTRDLCMLIDEANKRK